GDALIHISTILDIGLCWTLPVEQNCSLWATIPQVRVIEGKDPLFDRLFNLPPFGQLDGGLPKDTVAFVHPSFTQAGVPSPADNTLARLLAGLQVSSDQLAQMIRALASPLGADFSTASEADRGFK